ncbi:DNA polymerase III subunit psi [Vibrio sp. TH_r3]|uniref:DNA polymerase III subunit psi n=1 Tax=Vibrio sp. TH_r3 TaxID=3082084 RepID=UPI002953B76E|nr:DNA polymerase III subunit psi [Vibrio sp. TH_r3]MDV7106106.1 DNA polymerase III subunit psi [Vibrio sp. TH_r3]
MKEPNTDIQYLAEMGIQHWGLSHPARLSGVEVEPLRLPESCLLLLVSPVKPSGDMVFMFNNVLKSMKLSIEQSQHIYPEHFSQLSAAQLRWIWFAGCEPMNNIDTAVKTLTSPLLSQIEGNKQHRRDLWQQICAYE